MKQIAPTTGSNQPGVNPGRFVYIVRGRYLLVAGIEATVRSFLAVLIAAILVTAPSGSASAQQQQVLDLELKQGRFTSAKNTVRVTQGDTVTFRITSDLSGEIHLHGYDVPMKLEAGKLATTVLEARVAGRFPITSHGFEGEIEHGHGHKALLYLEVYPR